MGKKEKERVDAMMPDCTLALQEIYAQTKEGNGQKWLMIDLEEKGDLYGNIFRLIEIRNG